MRWRYFWNKEKTNEELENEEPLVKTPWYQAKATPAPKNCKALEAFIEACSRKFLDPENRRKMKSNLNPDMKKSIKKLKNLPASHDVAIRFSDKSGKAVITNLEDDDHDILEKLNDRTYYETLPDDPSDETKVEIVEWADKNKNNGAIDEDIHKYVTNLDDTTAAKTKPLIKIHKPTNRIQGDTKSEICILQLEHRLEIYQNLYKFVSSTFHHT